MRLARAPKVAVAEEDKVVAEEDKVVAEEDEGVADEDQRGGCIINCVTGYLVI